MKRRDFLSGLAAGLALGTPALAQDYVASITAQLRTQGFRSVVQERTLLGRVRIVASRKDGRREIIVNPRTGEILRDLWEPVSGGSRVVSIIDDITEDEGNDDEDSDDDGDDDDDDSGDDDSGDDDNDDGGDNHGGKDDGGDDD